ncbi:hypothetical protein FGO68_gene8521 [Halteria grandinella]|uniref:Uncharacterized protein n=1 Tax=Halteria grandinella TaxID=5974 RepID=A0A8J8N9P0_HALGN|nr:hypothetical protein FGO68_gene8521 [Halteria grandinella]
MIIISPLLVALVEAARFLAAAIQDYHILSYLLSTTVVGQSLQLCSLSQIQLQDYRLLESPVYLRMQSIFCHTPIYFYPKSTYIA